MADEQDTTGGFSTFVAELRRRKVIRVAAVYSAVAWVVLQVADVLLEPLQLPPWSMNLVLLLFAAGFPIALVLAWVFDTSPSGVRTASRSEMVSRSFGPGRYVDFVVIALLALAVGYLYFERFTTSGEPGDREITDATGDAIEHPATQTMRSGSINSIAILPFIDMTRENQSEYLGTGIADELISRFSEIGDIRVPSITSVMSLQDRGKSIREIGDSTKVASVLEGSIRGSGDTLLVVARLIDVASDRTLWQDNFELAVADVLTAQREIARQVLMALRPDAAPETVEKVIDVGTSSAGAYQEYLMGRQLTRSVNPDDFRVAIDRYDRALAIDPSFLAAKVYKAAAIGGMSHVFLEPLYDDEGKALVSELDQYDLPSWARAQLDRAKARLRGGVIYPEQERSARESMLGSGESSVDDLNNYGWVLAKAGLFDFAGQFLEKAQAIEPLNVDTNRKLGQVYASMGRITDAYETLRRCIQLAPNDRVCPYSLAWLRVSQGEAEQVLAEYRDKTGVRAQLIQAIATAGLGQTEESRRLYEDSGMSTEYMGYGHFLLWWGDMQGAFDQYATAAGLPDFFLIRQFAWPPHLVTEFKSDPRYEEHMERLGLTEDWRRELCHNTASLTGVTGIEVDCETAD